MAIQLIPLQPALPDYDMETPLGSSTTNRYVLHIYWNARDSAWYFDVSTSDGTAIASGLKIVTGTFIGRATQAEPFISGVFAAFDTSGQQKDAGFDDMGTRVVLYYIPVEDILANLATP